MLNIELSANTVVCSPAVRLSIPNASRRAGSTGLTMAESSAAMKTPTNRTWIRRRWAGSAGGALVDAGWLIQSSDWVGRSFTLLLLSNLPADALELLHKRNNFLKNMLLFCQVLRVKRAHLG